MSYNKPFYIACTPPGGLFAKTIQKSLQDIVNNRVWRIPWGREIKHRKIFNVTPHPLDKVKQFEQFTAHQIACPAYVCSVEEVGNLECKTIFARTLINSTNGKGIIEFEKDTEQYPDAPLYTEYIPKKEEYRVHVFAGEVIDIQQKRKKRGFVDERNTRVRNMDNGYVYCRDNINLPDNIAGLAVSAVDSVDYLYGAVEIGRASCRERV